MTEPQYNLEVLAHPDGTWLLFRTGTKSLMIQVEDLANSNKGQLGRMTLLAWCEDRQREAKARCPRCGEHCESEARPDGCRDLNCPLSP